LIVYFSMKDITRILLKIAKDLESLPTDPSDRVRQAIENTERVDPGYFSSTVKQRIPQSGSAAGSIYEDMSEAELVAKLKSAAWKPYSHPSIGGPATGFSAQIEGRVGVVALDDIPEGSRLMLDDRKNTGQVSLVLKGRSRGPRVGHTVILLGPAGQDDPTEIVWTFHPGDPIRPSMVNLKDAEQPETMEFVERVNKVMKGLFDKIKNKPGGAPGYVDRPLQFKSPQELHEAILKGIPVTKEQARKLGLTAVKIED